MVLSDSVVKELEKQARRLKRFGGIDPGSLVQEACVNLLKGKNDLPKERSDLLAYASRALRNTLVDIAKQRNAVKRGGRVGRQDLDAVEPAWTGPGASPEEVLDVHSALEKLARLDAHLARLVEMRYFGGYTCREIGEVLGDTEQRIEDRFKAIRKWLRTELRERAPRL